MSEHVSTRVNSARLPFYIGKMVRLPCKILNFNSASATVQAADGGEVIIRLIADIPMSDTFVEVIGNVVDATTIKMMGCVNLGSDLDLKLVNDTIELIHDPRFYKRMFVPDS
ncbi:replication factor A protein 3 [Crucibulum laeve]|uniref:Replication factor A protein 3 n=1 Tax=Crucibulum laeve TaxID=68775 RepID=A0A5C3LR21_9AGAR|nr:replication factor A protein 3 [Crucibulum laeve]